MYIIGITSNHSLMVKENFEILDFKINVNIQTHSNSNIQNIICQKDVNHCLWKTNYATTIYLFEVNNKSTRNRCEIYSKLPTKIPDRRQCYHSGVFIVYLELFSHLFLAFALLGLTK